jgi:hypothetical protein
VDSIDAIAAKRGISRFEGFEEAARLLRSSTKPGHTRRAG